MRFLGIILSAVVILIFIPLIIVKSCSYKQNENNRAKIDPVIDRNTKVKVYMHKEDEEVELPLEEYVKDVVAAEMPAEFELEALKAQAVAARTFALGRMIRMYGDSKTHPDSDICTNFAHCQAFMDRGEFIEENSKNSGKKLWDKISRAVNETRGIIILYKGKVANPLFHSNSGGYTEAAIDVWEGVDVPYLKSVASLGEDLGSKFIDSKTMSVGEFLEKIELKKSKVSAKGVLESLKYDRSATDRVKEITIMGKKMKGTEFRKLLNLCSTNFNIETQGEKSIRISTHGYGHGVGMSQWGANYLALNGGNFKEILKHYYTGIELKAMEKE